MVSCTILRGPIIWKTWCQYDLVKSGTKCFTEWEPIPIDAPDVCRPDSDKMRSVSHYCTGEVHTQRDMKNLRPSNITHIPRMESILP